MCIKKVKIKRKSGRLQLKRGQRLKSIMMNTSRGPTTREPVCNVAEISVI